MSPAFVRTSVLVCFGGSVTSKSPFPAVAVWARISLLTHSMVSPTLAEAAAGDTTKFSMTIWIVAACAGTAVAPSMSAIMIGRRPPVCMNGSLLQLSRNMFGVLLVTLKDLQARLQQVFQLGIAGG